MNIVTVTELNTYIKRKFDSDFILKGISIAGEISNYVAHSSGHAYFSLKDSTGVLKCVMFKGYKQYLDFAPENGMSVTATGDVNVFVRDGIYQLYVMHMAPKGQGELFRTFEERKKRLAEAGLFDETRKRPLPPYPTHIGVITSETGAVLHDIKNVLSRRYPIARIILYPAKVQGAGAAKTLIAALQRLNEDARCDVAILARGGGSFEDLWEFNDEALAYAIRASRIPVVSAVGHETDFTIADFAADLRAPTPSAAAELCVPDAAELRQILDGYAVRMQERLFTRIDRSRERLQTFSAKLAHGTSSALSAQRILLHELQNSLINAMQSRIHRGRLALVESAKRLEQNNPSAILLRGYGAIYAEQTRIRSARAVHVGEQLTVHMQDGLIHAQVTEVKHEI